MKKNYERMLKKNKSRPKEINCLQHSKSTQNLNSRFRNKINESNLLVISNPSTSKTITPLDLNENLTKMKVGDLSSSRKDHNSFKIEEDKINLIENNSDIAKYKQIIAYNEFLKDENFNLRMTLEKQKVYIL